MTQRIAHALDGLADRPASLLAFALFLNALFLPYANLDHDAGLYALQTLNRLEEGKFDGDLFFKYGSQDDYTIFSLVTGPLAGLVGLQTAFFLLYLLCKAFYLWAAQRLCFALLGANRWAVLAAIVAAIDPVPFGGQTLEAGEPFLTSRLPANACALLALAWLLNGRIVAPLSLFAVGFLLHPLMAIGPVLVALGWLAMTRLPRWAWAGSLAVALAAVAFAVLHRPTGMTLFGWMDPAWFEIARQTNRLVFPEMWSVESWILIGFAGAAVLWFAVAAPSREAARLAGVTCLAAGCGVALSILSTTELPYTLLLQGQPFRVIWLLQFLAIPATVALTVRLWELDARWGRGLAVVILLAVGLRWWNPIGLIVTGALLIICLAFGAAKQPRSDRWFAEAAINALVFSVILHALLLIGLLVREYLRYGDTLMPHEWFAHAGGFVDRVAALAIGLGLLAWAYRPLGRSLAAGCLVLTAGLQAGQFVPAQIDAYRQKFDRNWADSLFLAGAIDRDPAGQAPTLYWPARTHPREVWIGADCASYYCVFGNGITLFNRDVAMELADRRRRIRPIETYHFVAGHQGRHPARTDQWGQELFFSTNLSRPPAPPTIDDLKRLCGDPELDWVALRVRFPELAVADNGTWYLYNAAAIRAATDEGHADD